MKYGKIGLIVDVTPKAVERKEELVRDIDFVYVDDSGAGVNDVAVDDGLVKDIDLFLVLGGDGFMLHSLRRYMKYNVPFYGINCGTVGFLMNECTGPGGDALLDALSESEGNILHPLRMEVEDVDGKKFDELAINEVSLLRGTSQAAGLKISIDGKERMADLSCDGALVSTPAGSTAYNFSVHGPIIPLGSDLLVLTPISPFRPRNWKGALIPHNACVEFEILNCKRRTVNATADYKEVKNVRYVKVKEERNISINILFDAGHSLEERIIREQFV